MTLYNWKNYTYTFIKKNYKLMNQQTIFENDELIRYLSSFVSTNNDGSAKFSMDDRKMYWWTQSISTDTYT